VVAGLKWSFDFGIAKARVDKMRAEYDKLTYTKAFAEMNIPIQVAKSYQEHMEWQAPSNRIRKRQPPPGDDPYRDG